MNNESSSKIVITAILCLVIGLGGGYWYGSKKGYDLGYKMAQDDAKKVADEAAKKAIEDVAKAANPFQAVNPLQNVDANPFEKTQKILNPFAK